MSEKRIYRPVPNFTYAQIKSVIKEGKVDLFEDIALLSVITLSIGKSLIIIRKKKRLAEKIILKILLDQSRAQNNRCPTKRVFDYGIVLARAMFLSSF